MAITRRVFIKGVMDKDTDERLLPDGVFRHAENVLVTNSEGSDVGSVQNSYSNKKLTSIDFGDGIIHTTGVYSDEAEDKFYWFVKSDSGCFLMEYDLANSLTSFVLKDTRPLETRVLNVSPDFLITGIEKIISEDSSQDLLLWTDDNMEPCCINIERAKTWGENNFVLEDILLIKKPPRYAPVLTPTNKNDSANNIEEKFLSFSTRYKYLDGEYSALSSYSNYSFNPKPFDLDFYTLDNVGMVNDFNAVRIDFNTGEKQVTDIQLIAKESGSNNLYIVETFNKESEAWGNGQTRSYTFSNSKLYLSLPIDELKRNFDNVPLKAKALTIIGNRVVFGNYLEGRDLIDKNGKKVVVDYGLSLINEPLDYGSRLNEVLSLNTLKVTKPLGIELKKGYKLQLSIDLEIETNFPSYKSSFSYILPEDYATLQDLFASQYFIDFMPIIDNDFRLNFKFDFPPATNYVVMTAPIFSYSLVGGVPTFSVSPVTFQDTLNANSQHVKNFEFIVGSVINISKNSNSTSCKTNRDYEGGIVYKDKFDRETFVLTSLYNTIYIPQEFSTLKNRLKVNVISNPPAWADRYKIVIKAQKLEYQTIYVNRFYIEGFYVWCKLEAENKDKVKVGDLLIVKKAGADAINSPIKVKVLAIEEKLEDFIVANKNTDGKDLIEESGYYMKIRPDKFPMDFNDTEEKSNQSRVAQSSSFPITYLDLFSIPGAVSPEVPELAIPVGSSIDLYIKSNRNYDSGWKENIYNVKHYAQRDYDTLEDWFNENIIGRSLFGNEGNEVSDYKENISFFRGNETYSDPFYNYTENPNGKLYLKVKGTFSGGTRNRYGRVEAKITVRTNTGFYAFETEPKQLESDIYYQTEQTFDIVNGNHQGNLQNQDSNSSVPAIIDLDFFNCYTQGNGVESYRIKDGFNKKYLNIDLRPSATSIEEYKAVRRYADLTYSEPFIESTNINKLNEFNLSTANYKELDKQYGSVQKLHSRDNDILVLQEEKASKVMYGKDALYNGDGTLNVTSIEQVLGSQQLYLGENGIGKNPESFAMNNYQIFYANIKRGLVHRLSIDGVTSIISGMIDWFRDLSISNPGAKKFGGYDPYLDHYVLSVGEEPVKTYSANCGNTIIKSKQTTSFSYDLRLNDLEGDILLNYNLSEGNATISALYNGIAYVASNVTGVGTIAIPKTTTNKDLVSITVTPVSSLISYEISNICPLGKPMKVISIVLNEDNAIDKTITNRYKFGTSPYYSESVVFNATPVSKFTTEIGIEGKGRMPKSGSTISIQSFKDSFSNWDFKTEECNRLGYLVSSTVYTEATINDLLANVTYVTVSDSVDSLLNEVSSGNFVFNRANETEVLYLIWDYTNRKPIALNDNASIDNGSSFTINVLGNDDAKGSPIVTILTAPTNGIAVVNVDNTITYTHNASATTSDTIVYQLSNGICDSTASITIVISANQVVTEPPPPPTCTYPHYSTGVYNTINPISTGASPVVLINSFICLTDNYVNLTIGQSIPLTGTAGFIAIFDSTSDTNSQNYRIYQIDASGVIVSIFNAFGTQF